MYLLGLFYVLWYFGQTKSHQSFDYLVQPFLINFVMPASTENKFGESNTVINLPKLRNKKQTLQNPKTFYF